LRAGPKFSACNQAQHNRQQGNYSQQGIVSNPWSNQPEKIHIIYPGRSNLEALAVLTHNFNNGFTRSIVKYNFEVYPGFMAVLKSIFAYEECHTATIIGPFVCYNEPLFLDNFK
jgi:hypothetical protein